MILDRSKQDIESTYVKSILEKEGICIINNFIEEAKIKEFKVEFDQIFDSSSDGINIHAKKDSLISKVVDPQKYNFNKYKIFDELKQSQLFKNLSEKYLKGDFKLEKIMLQKTKFVRKEDMADKKLAFVPHTDETHFLKFFIYVSDVDEQNGPFSVLPGSHIKFKKDRKKWISMGKNRYDREKVVNQDISKMLPIIGKSGTLIIFDTDVAHKAGIVSENQHRSIVRFDYFSNYENSNLFHQRALIKIKNLFWKK